MRKILITLISLFVALGTFAESPDNILQNCVSKLKGAKSIVADFTMTVQGRTFTGTLNSKGNRFSVVTPGNATWYNGADIWSYSAASGEVTVWKPAAAELAESNPLLYLSTASDYTVKSGAAAGTVILTPKKRNSGVKNITLTVSSSTGLPKTLDIAANGGNIKIVMKSIRLNAPVDDSTFTFPKARYPKARLTDLR
ncbi:MAG: outer membrane lipoprotein carrier protein LolA [Muribaculaceae bacterium]|nr:outer membrane lipoprotein carrier protein LolA [Muribaculaceae bacterium]